MEVRFFGNWNNSEICLFSERFSRNLEQSEIEMKSFFFCWKMTILKSYLVFFVFSKVLLFCKLALHSKVAKKQFLRKNIFRPSKCRNSLKWEDSTTFYNFYYLSLRNKMYSTLGFMSEVLTILYPPFVNFYLKVLSVFEIEPKTCKWKYLWNSLYTPICPEIMGAKSMSANMHRGILSRGFLSAC